MVRILGARPLIDAQFDPYLVYRLAGAADIRARLNSERCYAAYALAQLSPHLFSMVSCWEARGTGGPALVVYSGGGLGDAVFMSGSAPALEAILRLHPGPRHNFATFRADHLAVVERYFRVTSARPMLRMAVNRDTFRPAYASVRRGARVGRLAAADARAVNRLYGSEGQPAWYSSSHIESGMYHGVFEERRLVAVAGTHAWSKDEGIAVVGNVFTHPAMRGLGYGTLATSAATAALLEHCTDVTLTVDPTNTPAVRAYLRLGYVEATRLIESQVTRRSLLGLRPAVRALAASWYGRGQDGELVRRRR